MPDSPGPDSPGPDRPGGALHRLFFALWPPQALRGQIERETGAIVAASGGRPTPSRNFHVTVVFIGEQPADRLAAVKEAAAPDRVPAIALRFDHVEFWPRPRVLVLSAAQTPDELTTLVDHLHNNLLKLQFKLKREVYRPHITLARHVSRPAAAQAIAPIEWQANELVLIESKPGSAYEVLARWPLA